MYKDQKIGKLIVLLLLSVAIMVTSAGSYYSIQTESGVADKTEKKNNQESKEEKVSASLNLEAVVPIVHIVLNKDIVFSPAEFFFMPAKRQIILTFAHFPEKYFRTLFTHIISPNAP